jgi:hypothetical protein
MRTLAQALYQDSEFGRVHELPSVGSALEHPLVFDSSAQELKQMASRGVVEIIEEHHVGDKPEAPIDRLLFRRLR